MSQPTALREKPAAAPTPTIGERIDKMPITPTHRRLTAVVGVGLLFDTFENNLAGTISKVLQEDFAFNGTTLKLVLASAFIGQFFGSVILGRVADRYGRRRAFLINLALYSGFSLLGAFSPNAAWLIVTRFFAGVGIGAEQSLSDCYLADVLPAKQRGRYTAWAYTLAFCGVPAVGFAALWLVPLSPLGIDGWRWLFVLGALGSAVVWVLRRNLIESPRWLAANGHEQQAHELVARMEAEVPAAEHPQPRLQAGAGKPAPALTEPSTPARVGAPASAPAGARATTHPPAARLREVFRARYRRRTTMLWLFCTLSVVGYYGFGALAPQILAAKGYDVVTSIGFTAVSFVGYPIGALLSVPVMDRMERKRLVALSAAAMALSGLGFAYATSPTLIMALGIAYTLVSNIFSTASHVYLAEQYPTLIRAQATGLAYSLSKLSAAALPFALLPVLDTYGPGPMFGVIAAAMGTLVAVVLLLGPRTTGVAVDHD
ncbi:MFS transporter [Streptomyces lasiicapitis]|uniref:MFS transporter n=1 Tax=Streptomyces lasiicapitis TaxID=1923961 RepID=UPI00332A3A72